ncbi:response regulator [Aquimarina sp. W85]|uniref:response regulator n=1 Tax=Aquimarina rhodophyticola TaxID=3342246 RepID=UPI00366F7BEA
MIKNEIKILLIEDNDTDVFLIKRQIDKIASNTVIQTAIDLSEIEAKLRVFTPDIILCDYNLPRCTGMEVLELIRNSSPATTFIFVTGSINNEELAANTILNGASGYILKKDMANLHSKLLPYFQAVDKNSAVRNSAKRRIDESKEAVAIIEEFLKNSFEENQIHKESISKIKEDLFKLKTKYDAEDS